MTTRLPPKTKLGNKDKKAGRRKIMEIENAEKERINQEIECCTNKLIEVLLRGGVPSDKTGGILQELLPKKEGDDETPNNNNAQRLLDGTILSLLQADGAVNSAWSYAKCYPSIDTNDLITVLNKFHSLLIDKATLTRKPIQRKLNDISNDPKADPTLLAQAKKNDDNITRVVTKCKVEGYKTRALMIAAGLNDKATSEGVE